ncbi:DUF6404 family protein [Enterobacter roggenkampii]|uniref:DUF6404 family protein n=1 Tax=Enterobacter roggenkampii TaxID=1812935 RepID=UPI002A8119FC|nr:DUF6404 family protein [Enterobacter roggenkampii]
MNKIHFEEKLEKSLSLMKERNMWELNYAPPLYKRLWKKGYQIPPPPFASVWLNTLIFGMYFSIVWGGLLLALLLLLDIFEVKIFLMYSFSAGILFGMSMSIYHLWRRVVNQLPEWDDL